MEKKCSNCKYFEVFREKYFRCLYYQEETEKACIIAIRNPDDYCCEHYKENNGDVRRVD